MNNFGGRKFFERSSRPRCPAWQPLASLVRNLPEEGNPSPYFASNHVCKSCPSCRGPRRPHGAALTAIKVPHFAGLRSSSPACGISHRVPMTRPRPPASWCCTPPACRSTAWRRRFGWGSRTVVRGWLVLRLLLETATPATNRHSSVLLCMQNKKGGASSHVGILLCMAPP